MDKAPIISFCTFFYDPMESIYIILCDSPELEDQFVFIIEKGDVKHKYYWSNFEERRIILGFVYLKYSFDVEDDFLSDFIDLFPKYNKWRMARFDELDENIKEYILSPSFSAEIKIRKKLK